MGFCLVLCSAVGLTDGEREVLSDRCLYDDGLIANSFVFCK